MQKSIVWMEIAFALSVVPALAQDSETALASPAFTLEGRAVSSTNSLGTFTRIDAAGGYSFNSHWSLSVGAPYYFLRPSDSVSATTGTGPVSGLGNAYSQIRFTSPIGGVTYVSTLTGTAPTGDRSKGLSTGHATFDWSNYFERGIGRLTPFGEIGFANAISDTDYFLRPYTTSGFVTHLQGGGRYRFTRWMSLGVSGYALETAGQQTVVSRVVVAPAASANGVAANVSANGVGVAASGALNGKSPKRVFESAATTTGSASIARDEGATAVLLFPVARNTSLYAGYSRSVRFDLNTYFAGIGVNLRKPTGF